MTIVKIGSVYEVRKGDFVVKRFLTYPAAATWVRENS